MNHPTIALGIPTYKRPRELAELLASVPPEVSVHVSDNGAFLDAAFRARHPGVHFEDTVSVLPMFANWNRALAITQGDWVAITSDDDLYLDGAFDRVRAAIEAHPTASMLVFGHHIIDGDGKVVSTWSPQAATLPAPQGFQHFRYGVDARMPSIFFRRSLLERLGGFDPAFSLTAADSDIIQRASLLAEVVFLPDVISGYRVWAGGLTHQMIASQDWMREIEVWCANVARFAREQGLDVYTAHLRDEIYARNLLSGIMIAREHAGFAAAWRHFRQCRFPFRALPATQARILYRLIRF